jgi:hypothetical protein
MEDLMHDLYNMNASLHRDDRRRDNLFRNFIHENGLKLANNHPERATFFHHNGKYKSIWYTFIYRQVPVLRTYTKVIPFHFGVL